MENTEYKILLIEDNPVDAQLVRKLLGKEKKISFNLKCCGCLDAGLKLIAKYSFDAILLDLGLPDSQGLETFLRVQAASPMVAIIVLTGSVDTKLAIKTLQKGGQDYLVKGAIGGNTLSRIIRYAIERKHGEIALRSALREKEVLLKEIHHRVKNNMQIIYSLLNIQSRHFKDKDVRNMLREVQNRVRSMALLHEKLYQSRDLARIEFGDYIQKLAFGLYHSFGVNPDDIKLKINVDSVSLGVNTAIPCGLIINELVTNSLRHAFPSGKRGRVSIDLLFHHDKELRLAVRDDGVGLPKNLDFRNTESLGLQLVNTLVEQLEGDIKLDRRSGTSFKITFIPSKENNNFLSKTSG